jgi:hypothetical protein
MKNSAADDQHITDHRRTRKTASADRDRPAFAWPTHRPGLAAGGRKNPMEIVRPQNRSKWRNKCWLGLQNSQPLDSRDRESQETSRKVEKSDRSLFLR